MLKNKIKQKFYSGSFSNEPRNKSKNDSKAEVYYISSNDSSSSECDDSIKVSTSNTKQRHFIKPKNLNSSLYSDVVHIISKNFDSEESRCNTDDDVNTKSYSATESVNKINKRKYQLIEEDDRIDAKKRKYTDLDGSKEKIKHKFNSRNDDPIIPQFLFDKTATSYVKNKKKSKLSNRQIHICKWLSPSSENKSFKEKQKDEEKYRSIEGDDRKDLVGRDAKIPPKFNSLNDGHIIPQFLFDKTATSYIKNKKKSKLSNSQIHICKWLSPSTENKSFKEKNKDKEEYRSIDGDHGQDSVVRYAEIKPKFSSQNDDLIIPQFLIDETATTYKKKKISDLNTSSENESSKKKKKDKKKYQSIERYDEKDLVDRDAKIKPKFSSQNDDLIIPQFLINETATSYKKKKKKSELNTSPENESSMKRKKDKEKYRSIEVDDGQDLVDRDAKIKPKFSSQNDDLIISQFLIDETATSYKKKKKSELNTLSGNESSKKNKKDREKYQSIDGYDGKDLVDRDAQIKPKFNSPNGDLIIPQFLINETATSYKKKKKKSELNTSPENESSMKRKKDKEKYRSIEVDDGQDLVDRDAKIKPKFSSQNDDLIISQFLIDETATSYKKKKKSELNTLSGNESSKKNKKDREKYQSIDGYDGKDLVDRDAQIKPKFNSPNGDLIIPQFLINETATSYKKKKKKSELNTSPENESSMKRKKDKEKYRSIEGDDGQDLVDRDAKIKPKFSSQNDDLIIPEFLIDETATSYKKKKSELNTFSGNESSKKKKKDKEKYQSIEGDDGKDLVDRDAKIKPKFNSRNDDLITPQFLFDETATSYKKKKKSELNTFSGNESSKKKKKDKEKYRSLEGDGGQDLVDRDAKIKPKFSSRNEDLIIPQFLIDETATSYKKKKKKIELNTSSENESSKKRKKDKEKYRSIEGDDRKDLVERDAKIKPKFNSRNDDLITPQFLFDETATSYKKKKKSELNTFSGNESSKKKKKDEEKYQSIEGDDGKDLVDRDAKIKPKFSSENYDLIIPQFLFDKTATSYVKNKKKSKLSNRQIHICKWLSPSSENKSFKEKKKDEEKYRSIEGDGGKNLVGRDAKIKPKLNSQNDDSIIQQVLFDLTANLYKKKKKSELSPSSKNKSFKERKIDNEKYRSIKRDDEIDGKKRKYKNLDDTKAKVKSIFNFRNDDLIIPQYVFDETTSLHKKKKTKNELSPSSENESFKEKKKDNEKYRSIKRDDGIDGKKPKYKDLDTSKAKIKSTLNFQNDDIIIPQLLFDETGTSHKKMKKKSESSSFSKNESFNEKNKDKEKYQSIKRDDGIDGKKRKYNDLDDSKAKIEPTFNSRTDDHILPEFLFDETDTLYRKKKKKSELSHRQINICKRLSFSENKSFKEKHQSAEEDDSEIENK